MNGWGLEINDLYCTVLYYTMYDDMHTYIFHSLKLSHHFALNLCTASWLYIGRKTNSHYHLGLRFTFTLHLGGSADACIQSDLQPFIHTFSEWGENCVKDTLKTKDKVLRTFLQSPEKRTRPNWSLVFSSLETRRKLLLVSGQSLAWGEHTNTHWGLYLNWSGRWLIQNGCQWSQHHFGSEHRRIQDLESSRPNLSESNLG